MNLIPSMIPGSGPIYSGIIILIGLMALVYGFKQF
jgi:hypothetical protein